MHSISSRWRKPKKRITKKMKERTDKIIQSRKENNRSETDESSVNSDNEFLLFEKAQLAQLVRNIVCDQCQERKVELVISERSGLSSKVALHCQGCNNSLGVTFTSSRVDCTPNKQAPFAINRRAVESAVAIGVGNAALEKFCIGLNIKPMSSRTFRLHFAALKKEAHQLEFKILAEACDQLKLAYKEADVHDTDILDISVSYDGTWHKRGHTSLYGVGFVVDIMTGLVIDFTILSKYCHMCTITAAELGADSPEFSFWFDGHCSSGECDINYSGSSGSMEVKAAEILWSRSVAKHGLRYTTMLSDGDARTWVHLNNISPYGRDVEIIKEECINHIHKRMGKGLRDIAQKSKLGGKKEGSLTGNKINLLTKYYRRAIVQNLESIELMQEAVKASLYHCSSTDKRPMHQYCPRGILSWCSYNRALASNETPPPHAKNNLKLNEAVFKALIPLYERLSSEELLSRCTRGATQNINENLHAQVWRRCSKEIFVSKARIHMAAVEAVMEKSKGVLESQIIKSRNSNRELSTIQQTVYERSDKNRLKRKIKQESYRTSKRKKSLNNSRKKKEKSTDYATGAH